MVYELGRRPQAIKMRIPSGAPQTFSLRIRQRFPSLSRISRPSVGTIGVAITLALTSAAVFGVCVYPYIRKDYYQDAQKHDRAFLKADREELAHGQRPWSNPFERK
ncbi:unnamed protein product [Anisakis simplex]|uniref:Small integral membrane protein 20 n=1 Tax=Anisakis simplex TaxID=6269 RepID=A0A0M3J3E7_ANISI|nr:unnamed protein product [Anisakis simplex]